jgi:hypothetical protein
MITSHNRRRLTLTDSFFDSLFHLARTPEAALFIVPIMAIASLQQFLKFNPVIASALLFTLAILYTPEMAKMVSRMEKTSKRQQGKLIGAFALIIGCLAITTALLGFIDPAQAQFFQGVQTWMATAIPGISAPMLALVFNVLRGVFVLYLGIGIVKVIQSAREGEDWQTLARTPLIIVVAVTMGDSLAGMIIGTGATTPTI